MKKLIVLALVVLGLLAIVPAMELQSSTQVFSRVGMAEGRRRRVRNHSFERELTRRYSSIENYTLPNGGTDMKKLIVLALVVLGLLAIVPAMELQSSTQVFSRVGMAEGGGGE